MQVNSLNRVANYFLLRQNFAFNCFEWRKSLAIEANMSKSPNMLTLQRIQYSTIEIFFLIQK